MSVTPPTPPDFPLPTDSPEDFDDKAYDCFPYVADAAGNCYANAQASETAATNSANSATASTNSATASAASALLSTNERIAAQAAAAAAEQAAGLTPDPDFGMVISTQSILNLKTSTFTAVVGETYRIDTSAGAFDFYPPAGMTQGQVFHIIDHAGTFNVNSPRLVAGSYKIMGETIDLILTQKNQRRTFEYAGVTKGLEF